MSSLLIIAVVALGAAALALAVSRRRRLDPEAALLADSIAVYGEQEGAERYRSIRLARVAIAEAAAARGLTLEWWDTMRVENRVLPGLDPVARDADIAAALDLVEADRATRQAIIDAARPRGVTLDGVAAERVLRIARYGRPLNDVIDDVAAGRAA